MHFQPVELKRKTSFDHLFSGKHISKFQITQENNVCTVTGYIFGMTCLSVKWSKSCAFGACECVCVCKKQRG